ncbi:MAG: ABC transporter permease [Acidobacteria bacterium]|nr:ABC transporter permease [Acidobacteriota bacterium]
MSFITDESARLTGLIAPAQKSTSAIQTGSLQYPSSSLPDQPVITGGGSVSRASLNLRELWEYRELLYFLTWRDIKVRYKQTAMGAAWAIVQPLFTMLVFTLFFSIFVGVPSDGIPYPVFAYAGLLPWTFFAGAVSNSSMSLIGSAGLITKVYFPRMIIPTASVCAGLVDLVIATVILIGLTLVYGVTLSWSLVMIPLLAALTIVLAMGVGILFAALTTRYRDVRHVLPFVLQLWMFSSPIIYPLSVVPEKWRWALELNPLTGIIEGFRSSLMGRAFNWRAIIVSSVVALAFLLASVFIFRRLEKSFADLM